MYEPQDIANWILGSIDRESGDSITHLKLQKLLYYAQAWALVILNHPLFDEDFRAWTHGPVLLSIFRKYKNFGCEAINIPNKIKKIDADTEELLNDVLSAYGEKSAKMLERLTHSETPWVKARAGLPEEARCDNIITKSSMEVYYKKLYEEADEQ
jgi:uncharacterized phage-associated protein